MYIDAVEMINYESSGERRVMMGGGKVTVDHSLFYGEEKCSD